MNSVLRLTIFLFACLIPGLAISSGRSASAHSGNGVKRSCDYYLSGKLAHGEEFGKDIADSVSAQYILRIQKRIPFTETEVKIFLESGWPKLQAIAELNGTTPAQLARDFYQMQLDAL